MKPTDKPVHPVLYKETGIQKTVRDRGLGEGKYHLPMLPMAKLPRAKTNRVGFTLPKDNLQRKAITRSAVHEWHKKLHTAEPLPPCGTCKTAVCCRAKVINITKEEHESGLYDSIEMPVSMLTGVNKNLQFILAKELDEPCPYLGDHNECTIYETRPGVCRVYSCLNDTNITPEMREKYDPYDD